MERKNIIAQTTAGRLQKAREGKWNGGQAPIGYKINSETGILEIDEEYAGVIRIIFEKYANTNLGYTGIAEFLTKQGYTKRIYKGKEKELPYFSASTVKKIIDNPTYCGKIVYGRTKQEHSKGKTSRVMVEDYEIYPGLHKPIIDEELFNSAQAKRKKTGKRSSRDCGTAGEEDLIDNKGMQPNYYKGADSGTELYGVLLCNGETDRKVHRQGDQS